MEIHNKNTKVRESGEWEDYTDGIDKYSPEAEAQQEFTELENERFNSLSLAGQIAEVSGGNVEDIQVLLDEAAENDYPNQVVLETLQETLGISEDEMINKVLPILRDHGFEGDYSADHYDVDYPEEETVVFEESKKKMTEAYSANRGSASKSYTELHPEAKENMREGVNTISFEKKDRNNVEVTFDTEDGVHTDTYDVHKAVDIARDWIRKDYVCKVNGKPVDDPTVFDDMNDEGEMTCIAPWFECSPARTNRMTEAYSANRGSATKSYAELHPETTERMKEASYQKFELPKKATPGDKEYNPDEPGKKPAKRDWTSGKMKSVNGIYGRRAWEIKKTK